MRSERSSKHAEHIDRFLSACSGHVLHVAIADHLNSVGDTGSGFVHEQRWHHTLPTASQRFACKSFEGFSFLGGFFE